jgi:RNA polymerase sigma-70 factor (ECF subfamily)
VAIGEDFAQVVVAAAEGDRSAIERLYRDTVPLVRGYFAANRARDIDDLTSDVYVSMMGSLGRFEGDEDRFRSWLLTIAHRRLVDSYRRSGRRPEDPVILGEAGTDVIDLTNAESEALSRLQAAGVLAAIDRLTEDQRAVLLLRSLADLPIKDICEVVGKPETAVKALLRRALASLERQLKAAGEIDEVDDAPEAPPATG